MKQLVPPVLPEPSDDRLTIVAPESGIDRAAFLKSWRDQMRLPKPDSKCLANDMNAWSTAVIGAEWFSRRYSPTARALLAKPKVVVADYRIIDEAEIVCGELVEPLSRYSAGWVKSLAVFRPGGLSNPVTSAIREAQRYGATRVRVGMTRGDDPVLRSAASADDFLRRPQTRHRCDQQTALDGFVSKLGETILRAGNRPQGSGSDDQTELMRCQQRRAIEEYGAAQRIALTDEQREANRQQAVAFLDPVLNDLVKQHRYQQKYLSQAYESVLRTYLNRLASGRQLDGTEHFLRLRLTAVRIDEWRSQQAKRKRESPFVMNQDGAGHSDDRMDLPPDADSAGLDDLVTRTIELINTDPRQQLNNQLSWEAAMAIELLSGKALELENVDEVTAYIEKAWRERRPTHGRSVAAAQAAMDVMLLLRTATNRAMRS